MIPVFDISVDLKKSKGSYLYDSKSDSQFLDFHGNFSSLALGYNHPIFDSKFEEKVVLFSKLKTTTNLYECEDYRNFHNNFSRYCFSKHIHFACTGSLAVEAAIKSAIDKSRFQQPLVFGLKKSFHGINSWGFLTDRYLGTKDRLQYFPTNNWSNKSIDQLIKDLENNTYSSQLVAIIVELIQSTSGDIYLDKKKLKKLRDLCNFRKVCFIADEVQTGFGVTGSMWHSQNINIEPDIIVFGKKAQVSGIIANNEYSSCINSDLRKLQVTFDGDIIDIIRSNYILNAIEKYELMLNVKKNQKIFREILIDKTLNYRGIGHLIAFDFKSTDKRDIFFRRCFEKKLLCNKGGDVSIRMRPNLSVNENDIDHFYSIFKTIL